MDSLAAFFDSLSSNVSSDSAPSKALTPVIRSPYFELQLADRAKRPKRVRRTQEKSKDADEGDGSFTGTRNITVGSNFGNLQCRGGRKDAMPLEMFARGHERAASKMAEERAAAKKIERTKCRKKRKICTLPLSEPTSSSSSHPQIPAVVIRSPYFPAQRSKSHIVQCHDAIEPPQTHDTDEPREIPDDIAMATEVEEPGGKRKGNKRKREERATERMKKESETLVAVAQEEEKRPPKRRKSNKEENHAGIEVGDGVHLQEIPKKKRGGQKRSNLPATSTPSATSNISSLSSSEQNPRKGEVEVNPVVSADVTADTHDPPSQRTRKTRKRKAREMQTGTDGDCDASSQRSKKPRKKRGLNEGEATKDIDDVVPTVIRSHYFPLHPPSRALFDPEPSSSPVTPSKPRLPKKAPEPILVDSQNRETLQVPIPDLLPSLQNSPSSLERPQSLQLDEAAPHGYSHRGNQYGLIQEEIMELEDRNTIWRHNMATTLLNVTTGRQAIPVFWKILSLWPTPELLKDGMPLAFLQLTVADGL
ncbi:hypothetical protein BT69DRAFT_1337586 [Atractiella rhizophila]|nr:hypothetical protein BT69DRAFT_1337586 [Atractiella rhizophila]